LCPAEWGGLAEIEGEDKLIQSGEEMEPIGCCVPGDTELFADSRTRMAASYSVMERSEGRAGVFM